MLTKVPRKLFIGGIPQNTTREELHAYFEQYGSIEDLNVTFKRENKGKGFGFLLFKEKESMDAVLADYENHKINGCWFECQIAKPKFSENFGLSAKSQNRSSARILTAVRRLSVRVKWLMTS